MKHKTTPKHPIASNRAEKARNSFFNTQVVSGQRKGGSKPVKRVLDGSLVRLPLRERRDLLPSVCNSMRQVEAIFGIPRDLLEYVKGQGVPGIFDASNRVNVVPLLRYLNPILQGIFAGGKLRDGVSGDGYLDPDEQLARLRKEQADDAARENAIKDGEIHTREQVEALLWENGLGRMRAEYLTMLKTYRQQPTPEVAVQIVSQQLPAVIEIIRAMLPKQCEAAEEKEKAETK